MKIRLDLSKPNRIVPVVGDFLVLLGADPFSGKRKVVRRELVCIRDEVNEQLYVEHVDLFLEEYP